MNKELAEVQLSLKKFNKVIIWGLRKKYHTHRYIHQAYYESFKKLGKEVVWVEDEVESQKIVQPGDLLFAAEPVGRFVGEKRVLADYALPIRNDVYYCLHNYQDIFLNKLDSSRVLKLQVYLRDKEVFEQIGLDTFFDNKSNTLYQAWATDLMPWEFKEPIFSKSPFVFWVGSIWDNELHQGNKLAINNLKLALRENNLKFVQVRFVPNSLNSLLIRHSRLSPAVAGEYQVNIDYLPDRYFKNLSYGQLPFTNVKKLNELFSGPAANLNSTKEQIDTLLALSKSEYLAEVNRQQEICKSHFTYLQKIRNIANCFDRLENS